MGSLQRETGKVPQKVGRTQGSAGMVLWMWRFLSVLYSRSPSLNEDMLGIGGLFDCAWHGSPELGGPSSVLGLEIALEPRSHPACYQVAC